MTEYSNDQTSGPGMGTWAEAIPLVEHLHHALVYGNVTAWLTYELYRDPGGHPVALYDDNGVKTHKFYTLKQYFHYVRPGAIRLETQSDQNDVLVTSFIHKGDNQLTIVAINRDNVAHNVDFNINSVPGLSTFNVIRTSPSENTTDLGSVSVTGSSFSYNLPSESVTTFHGTLGSAPPSDVNVDIDGSVEHQTIIGMGGQIESHTEYENNDYFWDLLFNDVGVSMLFTYGYLGHDNTDVIERFPVLVHAKNRGVQEFLAHMGSPPQSWKDANANLLPEYYDDYGDLIVNYIDNMETNTGVKYTQVCPNNEPGIGTPGDIFHFRISRSEYPKFLKIVGPKIRSNYPNIDILAPDDWNIDGSIQYANRLLPDSVAKGYVDIMSTHTYNWGSLSTPALWQTYAALAQNHNKPVAHSEGWLGGGHVMPHPSGIRTAKLIHHAFVDGQAIQFIWWDMLDRGSLDTPVGFIYSKDWPCIPMTNAGKPGGCEFPTDHVTKWGHAFKQYAHWIRPGAKRVDATSDNSNVLVSSYKHQYDSTFTIVAINDGTTSKTVDFSISNVNLVSDLDIHRTSVSEDSVNLGQVALSSGSFTYVLLAESTTTFSGSISTSCTTFQDVIANMNQWRQGQMAMPQLITSVKDWKNC